MQLPESTIQTKQVIQKTRIIGDTKLEVKLRFDDSCGNGHNTFAITGTIWERHHGKWYESGGGRCHDQIVSFFPELKPFIKWHLCSTDGPMHYVANTMYHASDVKEYQHYVSLLGGDLHGECSLGLFSDDKLEKIKAHYAGFDLRIRTEIASNYHEANIDLARESAIWPDATLEQLRDKNALLARLPALMIEFKRDMESLGFQY